jgi:hypothetical protein
MAPFGGAPVARAAPPGGGVEIGALPVRKMGEIIGARGEPMNGVLPFALSRKDMGKVKGPSNVRFSPDFELNGDLFFQPLPDGEAFLNADMAFPSEEVNPFIAALIKNNLVVQAFHQHFPMQPQVWFIHFRGKGKPLDLAKDVRTALNTTKIPLPQSTPNNPQTPLDAERLAKILHGHASVGEGGVVTVRVLRTDPVDIEGIKANPQANISTNIDFLPLGGTQAAVVPDFSMRTKEVNPVINRMLSEFKWFQGRLYNQETGEHPQLYFDHMVKTGDAYQLAQEIRKGLDHALKMLNSVSIINGSRSPTRPWA